MYEALKARLLWLLKVPPEPLDPMGDVRTLRVFRAAPGYWRYMAVGWLLAEVVVLLGILAAGGVQLAGSIEEILGSHKLLSGPRSGAAPVAGIHSVIQKSHTERQTTLLVRLTGRLADTSWQVDDVGLEEIVLAYLGQQAPQSARVPGALELAS